MIGIEIYNKDEKYEIQNKLLTQSIQIKNLKNYKFKENFYEASE
jgi:hypothetical protein